MASVTYQMQYAACDVTIVGVELPQRWLLAVEIRRPGAEVMLWRDRRHTYADFSSARSAGMLWATRFIDSGGKHQEELPFGEGQDLDVSMSHLRRHFSD